MPRTAPVPNMIAIPGMNPGLFVMGGGGDGGGSGAGSGNGKGGKQGANGKNGGKDANGGGKDAKGCGAGSGGGCTNCGQNIGKGDPVDVVTGEVYTTAETDLFLPGWFNLEIVRSYSSARCFVDVGIGFGWTHSLAWTLEERRRYLTLRTGEGSTETLPVLKEIGQQAVVGPWGLLRTEGGYALRPGNEFIHHFAKTDPESNVYRLVGITFRARGSIRLEYEGDRLARAIDSAGRQILFAAAPDGRIGAIRVPAPSGESITFARFEYDQNGDLVQVTDADGHATHYAYDGDHRLTRLEYPNGVVFHFVYDRMGRAVETWGERLSGPDPAIAPEAPSVLHDGRPAKGILPCRFEYGADFTEVVDSVRLQRFTRGAADQIAKAVNARGGVTTRTFDDRDRVTSLTDPTGATWAWQYDDMDKIVREENPDGQMIAVQRDGLGRELEVMDPAGGVTVIERDEHGEMLSMRNQKGGILQLNQLQRGSAREMIDEGGRVHRFEYDAHGNCTARTFPNGGRYEFTHDHWGRLLTIQNPLGHKVENRYNNAGLLTQETDPIGRVTTHRYDAMRNLISTTLPDGTTTSYEYGGLNWLTRVTHPDGSELRGFYNREGWLLYMLNERGERSDRFHFEDGNLKSETLFHGATIRYQRDLLGRIVGFDEGEGPHELKLSPAGNLLEHATSEGPTVTFEYDPRGELTLAASPDVTLRFEPDAIGKVARESVTVDGRTYEIKSARDPAGDRQSVRTSLGHELTMKRDPLGRVAEITDPGGRVLNLVRTPVGAIDRIELPGGAAIADARDAANRLRRRRVTEPGATGRPEHEPQWVGGARSGAIDRQYEYTPVDELQSVSTSAGDTDVFEYDLRRRLVRRQGSGGKREELRVDACSNYSEVGVGRPTTAYETGNLLKAWGKNEYRHDARGFLVEKTVWPDEDREPDVWRYTWDPFGNLQSVQRPDGVTVELSYDAFARRVAKRTRRGAEVLSRTHYVWDLASLLHEVKIGPDGETQSVRTYLYEDSDDAMPLGHRDSNGAGWVYYVEDVIGTPTDLVDAQGRLVGRLERTTFGKARPAEGSQDTTQFRFPGQYEDEETGLHYNRFRYYDPEIGRYISPDPIGYFGGLNLFAYGPNPIGYQDVLGLVTAQLINAPSAFNTFTGGATGYQSGQQVTPGLNTAPTGQNPRNNSCGEQCFAQDLMAFGKTKQARSIPRKNRNYTLQGKYPPCPTCHGAMMRAAADTNSTVNYQWEQPTGTMNTVTYTGKGNGTCKVTGSDTGAAQTLVGGYDHQLGPSANPRSPTTQGLFGVSFSGQSDQTYADLRQQQKDAR